MMRCTEELQHKNVNVGNEGWAGADEVSNARKIGMLRWDWTGCMLIAGMEV